LSLGGVTQDDLRRKRRKKRKESVVGSGSRESGAILSGEGQLLVTRAETLIPFPDI
jgi:hypothetical protein